MSSNAKEDDYAMMHRLEIQRGLGRVEGKLDQIILGMTAHETRDQVRFDEVNVRIDKLDTRQNRTERKIWLWSGAIAIVAFVLSHIPYSSLIGK